jgi:trans-aconitate 2-methyltransferase
MADWDGAGYAHISELQRTIATDSLATVVVYGSERVLDVGCGDGYLTRLIARRVPGGAVLGIDPSPRMIAAARTAEDQITNVAFEVGDVTTMAFGPDFDLVVSFNALHWVTGQALAYRNIGAALKPAGRVVVQFVCSGPTPSIEQVAMDVTQDARWARSFSGFEQPFAHIEPDDLSAIAAGAGLEVTQLSVADREWDFGSRNQFVQWCTIGFTDWASRLPAADVPQFVDEVVDRYEAVVGRQGLFRFRQLRAELRSRPGLLDDAR